MKHTYQHKKGGRYILICEAKHSETGEMMVVYKSCDRDEYWVRPAAMFYDGRFTQEHVVPLDHWVEDRGLVGLREDISALVKYLGPTEAVRQIIRAIRHAI